MKKIVELFKKTCNNAQELSFESFLILLKIIANNFQSEEEKSEDEKYQDFINYLEIENYEKVNKTY